ncbi:nuclear pore protein [Grosmannia clavigera kw1407]|uniref:Nuclear pore protein n=1 Tax=Grosmannia clavigera (strain kw1407 / UAMH 11150) TaxID=655863 RepID=F0XTQ9_GROCL|nr:nuclear pore protein [Grosmannia clavigera kw1407]EFW98745.1 nuclear pore protein [Grosmannia clavigera kw1407]
MSLFGNTARAPTASPFGASLSGSTALSSNAQAPAGSGARPSVFGSSLWDTSASGINAARPAGNPLFGVGGTGAGTATLTGSTTAPNFQSSTFNASTATVRPAGTGAYFDSLLAKSRMRSESGEGGAGSGSGGLGAAAGSADLPSLHLGLGDLRQKLRKLGPRGAGMGESIGGSGAAGGPGTSLYDGKAHYILAASGVDPGAAVRDLGNLSIYASTRPTAGAGASFGPGGAVAAGGGGTTAEVDVDTYLANLQTKTTLSMINDGLERSVRDFDSFLEDNVTMEWEAQRKRIYEHFGIKTRDELAGAGGASRYGDTMGGAGGGGAGGGGFGRSRRRQQQQQQQQQNNSQTPGPKAGGSVFGRSRMQKSVIGSASRIGSHASEFTDVETAGGSSSGGSGSAASVDDRYTREKQGRLAETIHRLNDCRIASAPFPILSEMVAVEDGLGGDRHHALVSDAFRALAGIVGEDADSVHQAHHTRGEPGPRQRAFARAYLDPNPSSAGAISVRQQILNGANRFLERRFFAEVEAQIAKFPQEASLGGRPDVVSKIKAYIRVRAAQKMLVPDNVDLQQVQGEYVWAVIFYLLRSGHVTEAAQYVNDNQTQIRGIDRVFASYINSYATSDDRRLKRAMQERCSSDYTQRARNAPEGSVDPFRMACYKVIGRCDVGNRSLDNLQTDVHDWIWLQFNLAREGDRAAELASEMYGLAELQETVRDIGQKHFAKNAAGVADGSFAMFFYLQVLAGLFEPAIAYLYSFAYVDAVHFAIALEYYGLLRTPDASLAAANELLSHNTRGLPQINFARMIGYYTRDFRAANVAAAVDYLVLICLGDDGEQQVQAQTQATAGAKEQTAAAVLCYEALRELVLETREFSKLIGDIRPDGTRIRGLVEERGGLIALDREQDFVRAITLQAARDADDGGRTTDAVLLYHLAGDYDTVVVIVSRALSEAIALEIGEEPMRLVPVKPRVEGNGNGNGNGDASVSTARSGSSLSLAAIDDPVELAQTMMTMYERDNMFRRRIREENRIACSVLLQMSEIKGLVEARKWPQCLDRIRDLEILPLQAGGDPSMIRSFAARFPGLAQPVAINVPNLLMWTILCCTQQRGRLLSGQFSGNESASRMLADELKQICVDLTAYTSQLRYRFPPYLHEALARASAD